MAGPVYHPALASGRRNRARLVPRLPRQLAAGDDAGVRERRVSRGRELPDGVGAGERGLRSRVGRGAGRLPDVPRREPGGLDLVGGRRLPRGGQRHAVDLPAVPRRRAPDVDRHLDQLDLYALAVRLRLANARLHARRRPGLRDLPRRSGHGRWGGTQNWVGGTLRARRHARRSSHLPRLPLGPSGPTCSRRTAARRRASFDHSINGTGDCFGCHQATVGRAPTSTTSTRRPARSPAATGKGGVAYPGSALIGSATQSSP